MLLRKFLQRCADGMIGRYPASDHQIRPATVLFDCAAQAVAQAFDRRLLEARGNVGVMILAAFLRAQDCALEPGEGELRLVGALQREIGRASWRERVCQYGEISVVAVTLK